MLQMVGHLLADVESTAQCCVVPFAFAKVKNFFFEVVRERKAVFSYTDGASLEADC